MARFAILSDGGDGFSLAYRLARDGHHAALWCRNARAKQIGGGIVDRLVYPDVPKGTTIIVDGVGMVDLATRFRARGFPVIGGHPLEVWETNRALGTRVMERGGLRIAETHTFTTLRDAFRFLASVPDESEWYFKPDGDVPKSMTRKGTVPMLTRFLRWAEPQLSGVPRFELQAPAPPGVEVDIAYWLNGHDIVAAEITLEEKKFLAGNVGPSTGCQANLLWDVSPTAALVVDALGPFTDDLLRARYRGIASLNTIITPENDIYGLEWTMRPGYYSTQAACALFGPDLGDQLAELATGGLSDFTRNKRDIALALAVSVPPQPLEDSKDDRRMQGLPLDPRLLGDDSFYPDDIALDREGLPVSATGSGHVGVFTAVGRDLQALRVQVLEAVREYEIPDAMYRVDPVSRADADLIALAKLDPEVARGAAHPPSLQATPHDKRPRFGRDDMPSTGQPGGGSSTPSSTPSATESSTASST